MRPVLRFVIALAFLVTAGVAAAVTRHVPAEFASIQTAVDASAAGDEVVVAAGIYVEQVVLTSARPR